jgi:ABC-type sulfate/molybdate transport systems ATPase subunit
VDLGVSLVLVTHDRAQAERLADDFVELEAGRVRVAA